MPLPVPPRVKKVPGPLCGGPVRNAPPAARTLARGPSRTRQVGKRHREGGSNPQRRSALLAWTRKEERQTPFDPKRQRLAKCSHQGQMALVSPVHRSLNVPKVDCAACDHVALLTPDFLLRLGLSPQAKVLDLKLRVRMRQSSHRPSRDGDGSVGEKCSFFSRHWSACHNRPYRRLRLRNRQQSQLRSISVV